MSRFIIFGTSNYNTLGAMRCMHDKQTESFLLLVSESCFNSVLLSKSAGAHKRVNNEEQGVLFLINRKEAWKGAVILPTSDKAERALDSHFDKLHQYYRYPHACGQWTVATLMGKELQIKLAKEAGLHVPITFRYKRGEKLPTGIVYPCIAKPQNSTTGEKDVLCECRNEKDLLRTIETSRHTEDFLIQQYIDKAYDVLLIGCRLPNGKIWLPGIFKKERWYQRGGDGSYGTISSQVGKLFSQRVEVHTFLEKLDYYGPFSIEFGVMNEIPYFYEINLRNDGTSHYFHKAGIYMPYIYYLACTNSLDEQSLNLPKIQYSFIDEFGDLINLKNTRLPLKRWLHDLRHASAYKYFHPHDIKPFLAIAPRRMASVLYRMIKSKEQAFHDPNSEKI